MSSSDVLAWAGLAAFFAAVGLLWWFARTEAEGQIGRVEIERQRRDKRRDKRQGKRFERLGQGDPRRLSGQRVQRAILGYSPLTGEVKTPPSPPDLPQPVYFPYGSWNGSWQPPRMVPVVAPVGQVAQVPQVDPPVVRVVGRHTSPHDAAAAAAAAATDTALAAAIPEDAHNAREDEQVCPACLCVALENHQGFARGDWQQRIFVPVGALVTPGMLAGTTWLLLCAHHERALVALGETRRLETSAGLHAYAQRLIGRVRAGQNNEQREDDGADRDGGMVA